MLGVEGVVLVPGAVHDVRDVHELDVGAEGRRPARNHVEERAIAASGQREAFSAVGDLHEVTLDRFPRTITGEAVLDRLLERVPDLRNSDQTVRTELLDRPRRVRPTGVLVHLTV